MAVSNSCRALLLVALVAICAPAGGALGALPHLRGSHARPMMHGSRGLQQAPELGSPPPPPEFWQSYAVTVGNPTQPDVALDYGDDDPPGVVAPSPQVRYDGATVEVWSDGAGSAADEEAKAFLYPAGGGEPLRLKGHSEYRCTPGFGTGAVIDAQGFLLPGSDLDSVFDVLELTDVVVVEPMPQGAVPIDCDDGDGGPAPPTGLPLGPAVIVGLLEGLYSAGQTSPDAFVVHAPLVPGDAAEGQHMVYLSLEADADGALAAALAAALGQEGVVTVRGELTDTILFGEGLRVSQLVLTRFDRGDTSDDPDVPPVTGSGPDAAFFGELEGIRAPGAPPSASPVGYVLHSPGKGASHLVYLMVPGGDAGEALLLQLHSAMGATAGVTVGGTVTSSTEFATGVRVTRLQVVSVQLGDATSQGPWTA